MRIKFTILFAIILCLLLSGCAQNKTLYDTFDAYDIEVDEQVPYVYYSTLVYNGREIDFRELLDKNTVNGSFHEVYVIRNKTIWFGYSDAKRNENGAKVWNIASVNSDGTGFNVVYSGEFCYKNESDQHYAQNNNSHSKDRYLKDNGFYGNGKIVLTDRVKLVEFDLETLKSEEILAENYEYPAMPFEVKIIDSKTIEFYRNSEKKIFTVESARKTSEAFEQLYELENEKNWDGISYLYDLFEKVQIVENKVYIICKVLNWYGETHAIVFAYDFEENNCRYAFHCFMDDIIGNRLYVVLELDE